MKLLSCVSNCTFFSNSHRQVPFISYVLFAFVKFQKVTYRSSLLKGGECNVRYVVFVSGEHRREGRVRHVVSINPVMYLYHVQLDLILSFLDQQLLSILAFVNRLSVLCELRELILRQNRMRLFTQTRVHLLWFLLLLSWEFFFFRVGSRIVSVMAGCGVRGHGSGVLITGWRFCWLAWAAGLAIGVVAAREEELWVRCPLYFRRANFFFPGILGKHEINEFFRYLCPI